MMLEELFNKSQAAPGVNYLPSAPGADVHHQVKTITPSADLMVRYKQHTRAGTCTHTGVHTHIYSVYIDICNTD